MNNIFDAADTGQYEPMTDTGEILLTMAALVRAAWTMLDDGETEHVNGRDDTYVPTEHVEKLSSVLDDLDRIPEPDGNVYYSLPALIERTITEHLQQVENLHRIVGDLSIDGRRYRSLLALFDRQNVGGQDAASLRMDQLNPQTSAEFSMALDALIVEGLLHDATLPPATWNGALHMAETSKSALHMARYIVGRTVKNDMCQSCGALDYKEQIPTLIHAPECVVNAALKTIENLGDNS